MNTKEKRKYNSNEIPIVKEIARKTSRSSNGSSGSSNSNSNSSSI